MSDDHVIFITDTNYLGFPKLYFRDPKTGLFESVANGGTSWSQLWNRAHKRTGLLIYYQNRGSMDVANGGPGLKAFPEGFRMITGDPKTRSFKYAQVSHPSCPNSLSPPDTLLAWEPKLNSPNAPSPGSVCVTRRVTRTMEVGYPLHKFPRVALILMSVIDRNWRISHHRLRGRVPI